MRDLLQLKASTILHYYNLYYCFRGPDYILDSGFQAAGEAVLVSQAAQQAQLQVYS
jgi:hypothetical protein